LKVPYILMHSKGDPKTMTSLANYDNLMEELITYFHQRVSRLRQLGVADIIVDPGFGFAKTRKQNFTLLNNLEGLQIIGQPVMVGLSRKSMVWKTLDINPAEALNGTTALHSLALYKGADILRVHDVKEAREVVNLLMELRSHAYTPTS
jgi:dihydropteroate synthase